MRVGNTKQENRHPESAACASSPPPVVSLLSFTHRCNNHTCGEGVLARVATVVHKQLHAVGARRIIAGVDDRLPLWHCGDCSCACCSAEPPCMCVCVCVPTAAAAAAAPTDQQRLRLAAAVAAAGRCVLSRLCSEDTPYLLLLMLCLLIFSSTRSYCWCSVCKEPRGTYEDVCPRQRQKHWEKSVQGVWRG